jgi:hypothetical protein
MSNRVSEGGVQGLDFLAKAALAGTACFVASALLLPLFSEYTLARDYISELAIGRFGFVQTIAFLAFGLGSLALAAGIRRATRGSWGSLVGSVLFGLFGVGVLIDAFFPIDRGGDRPQTMTGTVHILAASLAFVCAVLAMFVLTRTFKRNARWRSYWRLSLVLALVALVAFFLPSGQWAGISQRIFVGVVIAWMILAALRLRSIAGGASTQNPSRVR